VEQPFGARGRQQRGDQTAAGRLAEHGDPIGITAERVDVALNPAQGQQDVLQREVAVERHVGRAERREVEEPERADAVVHRHHDDVAGANERRPVVDRLTRRAERVGTAVQPHHDRQRCIRIARRAPDVEEEAVLILGGIGAEVECRVELLRGDGAESGGVHLPLDCRGGDRVTPAAHSGRWFGIADACEDIHVRQTGTAECSGGARRDRGGFRVLAHLRQRTVMRRRSPSPPRRLVYPRRAD